jgi:hypothetical protein
MRKWIEFFTGGIRIYILMAAVIFSIVGWGVKHGMDEARESTCLGNIYRIRHALERYRDEKGDYPPLYVADADGKPMHSWRVLILPYLPDDANELFRSYKFDEPWNGPNNRKLATQTPASYQCLFETKGTTTPYLMVSSSADRQKINQAGDDPILLVEFNRKMVHWMQPDDISIDEFNKMIAEGKLHKDSVHSSPGVSTKQWPNGRLENIPREK